MYLWVERVGEFLSALLAGVDGPGLMIVALADSSFLSIPEGNDLLIVILSTGKAWHQMAYYVGMTIIGSVVGCSLLYTVGRKGGSPLLQRKFSKERIEMVEKLFRKYGALTVVIPSLLPPPCPFKVFVLGAGVFRLKFSSFIAAVLAGRTARYAMWGILAIIYGNDVKTFMQEHLPAIGIGICIMFLLALFILAISYFASSRQRRQERKHAA